MSSGDRSLMLVAYAHTDAANAAGWCVEIGTLCAGLNRASTTDGNDSIISA